jgi:hypothetical protein
MKHIYTLAITALSIVFLAPTAKAQMVSDMVSIQQGYTHQSYYSMANGELANVSNTDWDLAFQIRGFAASILINSKKGISLWRANKDASQWSSMVTADTTYIVSDPAFQLFNSDTSWDFGAFNRTNDPANAFDLGWGFYDFITHAITGDSIFFIKLGPTDYRKLRIDNLTGGTYTFRHANLDGSNEIIATLSKSNFQGKYFGYYSFSSNTTIDREPVYNTWDLTFCQYYAQTPIAYMVTGVLSNDSVSVAKAYPVDTSINSPATFTFNDQINAINYDWKTINMGTFQWDISDSTVYFVRDRAGSLWKMVFTGFSGSSSGIFSFDKGPATPTGLFENSPVKTFGIYPNPTSGFTRMMIEAENTGNAVIQVTDVQGRLVNTQQSGLYTGLNTVDLDLTGLPAGLYQVSIRQGNDLQVTRVMIQ